MIPGISTACLYPMQTEQALAHLVDYRIQSTEVFINSDSELHPAFLQQLRTVADAGGTKILSLHPFTSPMESMLFFSRYPRRFADGCEQYKKYYQAANLLGASIVVFHGLYRQVEMPYEEYFERYGRLMEQARQYGVDLCHENVCRCYGHSPLFFREMQKALPQAGFVLDCKQAVRAGVDVFEMQQSMGSNIRHIHISDHNQKQDCMLLGHGKLPIQKLLDVLGENGYNGGIIVELYRENFGEIVEIIDSYQLLFNRLAIYPNAST